MDKNDLMKYLVEEAEYSESEVAEMTNTELLDIGWSTTEFAVTQRTSRMLLRLLLMYIWRTSHVQREYRNRQIWAHNAPISLLQHGLLRPRQER